MKVACTTCTPGAPFLSRTTQTGCSCAITSAAASGAPCLLFNMSGYTVSARARPFWCCSECFVGCIQDEPGSVIDLVDTCALSDSTVLPQYIQALKHVMHGHRLP